MADLVLKKTIYELEKALTQPDVRIDTGKIEEIVSDDFFEFCSCGTLYRYSPGDVFDDAYEHEIYDFDIKELGNSCILATYKTARKKKGSEKEYFLRSSVWHLEKDKWRMVFHQGTPAKK